MSRTDSFDIGRLALKPGQGKRLDLEVALEPLEFGGQRYEVVPALVPVTVDAARMSGSGHSLRLRFTASLHGPCMRCLKPATPEIEVDAREIDQPGGGDELASPYMTSDVLDVGAWVRDALVLAQGGDPILCREDCAGLCPICGADLNEAGAGGIPHRHEAEPDPRWAKLRELEL